MGERPCAPPENRRWLHLADVAYTGGYAVKRNLRLLLPRAEEARVRFPLAVLVPGGTCRAEHGMPACARLAERGYAVAIVGRGDLPEASFSRARDVRQAIRFLRSRAGVLHIDASRIFLADGCGNLLFLPEKLC